MDLFLVNFEKDKNRIKNKKLQSKISKTLSEKILHDFYGKKSELLHNTDGSPYFKDENEINISISHTGSIVALLFDNKKAGVDIEEFKNRNFKDILKYFKIDFENISKETFYQIWTDYEARYKSKLNQSKSFIYKDCMCSFSCNSPQCNIYEINYDTGNDKILSKNKIKAEILPELKIKINC